MSDRSNIRVVVDADASDLSRELRRARREIDQTADRTSKAARSARGLDRATNGQTAAVAGATKATTAAKNAVRDYDRAQASHAMRLMAQGKNYREIAREIGVTEDELRDLMRAQKDARRSNEQTENTNEQLERSYRGVGGAARRESAAVLGFNAALAKQRQTLVGSMQFARRAGFWMGAAGMAAGAHMLKTGMDYEAQMDRVQGVISGTRREMEMLDRTALKLGADTKFSASESAQALYELGAAGFNARTGAEALPGVLSLAAASSIELADAADIGAGAVFGFGLQAQDTAHVADVLAKVANTTAAEVSDLQLSMKYIAPVAQVTGQSLEEMMAALGVMAESTIRGEQAGTSLRAGLLRLVKPTKQVKTGLKEMGMSAKELYGPDGLLPLPELIGKLREGTDQLTQSEKARALAAVFGTEAVSGMLTLVDAGPARLAKLTRAYENADGAAKKAATTMQDNVAGALEQVGGALETQELLLYKTFQGPLQHLLRETADVIDTEGRQIQKAFKEAMATPEFDRADFAGKVDILGDVVSSEWDRIGVGDDIREFLTDAFSDAIPVVAEAAGEAGIHAAGALVDGFIGSSTWGRLIIGGWLFTKFGGVAALRAAGAKAGTEVAAGMATGASGGGLLGKGKGALMAAGKWGMYTTALFGGIEAADILFSQAAEDAEERLRQLDDDGSGIFGTLGRLTRDLPKFDLFGQNLNPARDFAESLADGGDDAHRLLEILEEIDTVGAKRASQLEREGKRLLENLELTKEQKDVIREQLATPDRVGAQKRVRDDIGILKSGALKNFKDIEKFFAGTMRKIDTGWEKGTKGWRDAVGKALDGQIEAVRDAYTKNGKLTEEGATKMRELALQALRITGDDPFLLADATFRSWRKAGDVTRQGINQLLKEMREMPAKERRIMGEILLGQVRDWENKDKKLKGSTKQLRSALTAEYRGTWRALSREEAQFHRSSDKSFKQWTGVVEQAVGNVVQALNNALGGLGLDPIGFETTRTKGKNGKHNPRSGHKHGQFYAKGGIARVAGEGLRDTVPLTHDQIAAMVAPGEDLAVINRHQRPLLDMAVANTFGHRGLDDFFRSNNRPHYMAEGGIIALGRQLQREGYQVGEHPAFGGVAPVHTTNSYHYRGMALDVNADGLPGGEAAWLDRLYARLQKMPGVVELLWRVADHFDHLHVAMGGPGGVLAGAGPFSVPELPKWTLNGPNGALKDIGQAVIDRVYEGATEYLQNAMPKAGTGTPFFAADAIKGPGRIVGASTFGGPGDPGTGSVGYRGDNLNGKMAYAELGMGQFLGGLPYGHPLKITAGGRSVIANKLDIGAGGADVQGHRTDIDLWHETAAALGLPGVWKGLVKIQGAQRGGFLELAAGTASLSAAAKKPLTQAQRINRIEKDAEQEIKKLERQMDRIDDREGSGKKGKVTKADEAARAVEKKAIREKIRAIKEETRGKVRKVKRGDRKRARVRRRRLKKLEGRGLPRGMLSRDGRIVNRVNSLDDDIELADTKAGWASSPDGEDMSESEAQHLISLHQEKLEELRKRRKLLKQARRVLGREIKRTRKDIEAAKPRWIRDKKSRKWVRNPLNGRLPALRTNLTNLTDAERDVVENLHAVAGHNERGGGEILQTRSQIEMLGARPPAERNDGDSELQELLREQLAEARRTADLSQMEFGVFRDFFAQLGPGLPFLGAFAQGTDGKRVGRTGLAVLHKDEVVTTDPAGPFGSQLAQPPATSAAPVINLYMEGDVGPLMRRVRAEVDGRAAQVVDRQLGRRARQLSVAPGG